MELKFTKSSLDYGREVFLFYLLGSILAAFIAPTDTLLIGVFYAVRVFVITYIVTFSARFLLDVCVHIDQKQWTARIEEWGRETQLLEKSFFISAVLGLILAIVLTFCGVGAGIKEFIFCWMAGCFTPFFIGGILWVLGYCGLLLLDGVGEFIQNQQRQKLTS